MKRFYIDVALAGGSLVVAGVTALVTFISRSKVERVCKTLDRTMDELSDKNLQVNVAQDIIDATVEREVKNSVARMIPKAIEIGRNSAINTFEDAVQREINEQYDSIKTDVAREVKAKVGNIDISGVKKQVIADAKEAAMEKFHGELEDVLSKFNDQLDDLSNIYSSIAKKFQ